MTETTQAANGGVVPTDAFSRRRRELGENPSALGAGSTLHLIDFYGNGETWVVETFRTEGEKGKPETTVFLQRSSLQDPVRIMIRPEVMRAILRHDASIEARIRRRGARKAAATRKALGIVPGFLKTRRGKKA